MKEVERLPTFFTGLYYTKFSTIDGNDIINQKFSEEYYCLVWPGRPSRFNNDAKDN